MASMTTRTTSSSAAPPCTYDVFLCFRGPDTRNTFTSNLRDFLEGRGITVFMDVETQELGEIVVDGILSAISESRYAIVVISSDFASSRWCLRELVKIMKHVNEKRLEVLPIYYCVRPKDLQRVAGQFGVDFFGARKQLEVSMGEIRAWGSALHQVAWVRSRWFIPDRDEFSVIQEICALVFKGLSGHLSSRVRKRAGVCSQRPISSSTLEWAYDVFLSFHGSDAGFTNHLRSILEKERISVFKDNDEGLPRRNYPSEQNFKAIQESRYVIVVISKNYFSSEGCLDELTLIVDYKRGGRSTILPVFYNVDPIDVKEHLQEALHEHKQHPVVDEGQINSWKSALEEVVEICGCRVDSRHDIKHIERICERIRGRSQNFLNISKELIGMKSQAEKVLDLLCVGHGDVRFIGIHGMGGIGKTSLAEDIYVKVASQFEASSFIRNVGENPSSLVDLQRQLICDILNGRNLDNSETWTIDQGTVMVAHRVHNKKVCIVVDDVNERKQIKALVGTKDWFGLGSRIIITSRDRYLLEPCVDDTYEVGVLNDEDSLQLFISKAFKKCYPERNYVEVSRDIVKYAGGLPLAIEAYGSFLCHKLMTEVTSSFLTHSQMDAWNSARDELQGKSRDEVLDRLEISYAGLEDDQKMLFLDLACFFNGDDVDEVIHKLEYLGYNPKINFVVLIGKSLLKISNRKIQMHDLVVKMGQRIVHRESPEEPTGRSRLWQHDDIIQVLKSNIETNLVEGIVLKLPLPKQEKLNFEVFSKMKNLRILMIRPKSFSQDGACDDKVFEDLRTLEWVGDPSQLKLNDKLAIMEWWGCPLESLPNGFQRHTDICQNVRLDIHTKQGKRNGFTPSSSKQFL